MKSAEYIRLAFAWWNRVPLFRESISPQAAALALAQARLLTRMAKTATIMEGR